MKSFSSFTLFVYNNDRPSEQNLVPWPRVQEHVGERAFRHLLEDPECEVYLEHDDFDLGFPTSRVLVDFYTQHSERQFQKMRSDK